MVGASGAISESLPGIYYSTRGQTSAYFTGSFYLSAPLSSCLYGSGLWVFEQMIALPESMKQAGGVAIAAHLGGFASGVLLTPFMRKPGVRLFQDGRSRSFTRQSRRLR